MEDQTKTQREIAKELKDGGMQCPLRKRGNRDMEMPDYQPRSLYWTIRMFFLGWRINIEHFIRRGWWRTNFGQWVCERSNHNGPFGIQEFRGRNGFISHHCFRCQKRVP